MARFGHPKFSNLGPKVSVDGGNVARSFDVEVPYADHTERISVALRDGRWTATAVTLEAPTGITAEHSRSLNELVRAIPKLVWFLAGAPIQFADGTAYGATNWTDFAIKTEARQRRKAVTPERLSQVSAAYDRAGVEGVQQDLHLSRAQAFRLIKLAYNEGMITKDGA